MKGHTVEKGKQGFDIGFSEEEKTDLENMIRDFNADQPSLSPEIPAEELQTRVGELHEKISQMGEIVQKINRRIDAFYEIIQLLHQKSGVMSQRIDTVIASTHTLKDT